MFNSVCIYAILSNDFGATVFSAKRKKKTNIRLDLERSTAEKFLCKHKARF